MPEPQSAGDYNIVSFLIHSHRSDEPIEIGRHIDEIEIYENIELPYFLYSAPPLKHMHIYLLPFY